MLRAHLKKMTWFLVALIGAVWIHRAILCFVFHVDQAYIFAAFDTRLDELMVGCLVAVLLKRRAIPRLWGVISKSALLPFLTLGTLAVSIYAGDVHVNIYRDVFGFAIEPLLIAILIVQMISFSSTRLWKWTEWSAVKFLGRISYSLYLYQQLSLYSVRNALGHYPVVVQLAGAITVTIILATLSHYVVERPFLKLKTSAPRVRKELAYEAAQ
jgi:peptidoglycan/LPS O-acetylase OafA/YrhL